MSKDTPVILVVEDDDIDYMLLERQVRARAVDARLVRATDALEGLAYLRRAATNAADWPAMTILDLNTPRMSGFDFLDEVRSDERIAHVTVMVFTTSTARGDIEEAYRRNVAGYVVKEVEAVQLSDFLSVVEAYLKSVRPPPALEPVR